MTNEKAKRAAEVIMERLYVAGFDHRLFLRKKRGDNLELPYNRIAFRNELARIIQKEMEGDDE